jgi:hypothetical protein
MLYVKSYVPLLKLFLHVSPGILSDLFPGVQLPAIDYLDITEALTANAAKVGEMIHPRCMHIAPFLLSMDEILFPDLSY